MKVPQANSPRFGHWRTNRVAAVGFLVLLLPLMTYLLFDPDTFRKLRDGFYLGIIPLLTVSGILACSVSLMFDQYRKDPFHKADYENRPTWFRVLLAVGALVSMYVYYHLMLSIGFPVATVAYVAALMMVMGVRNASVIAATAIFVTGFVIVVFTLLGFSLPLLPRAFV